MSKILVVDDETEVLYFLEDELSRQGYMVTCVNNGLDALVLVTEEDFDLILLDMLMPYMDGIQTYRVLRKLAPEIPVIGLTGHVGQYYQKEATRLGIRLLFKPVHTNDLLREIQAGIKTQIKL